MFMGFTKHFYIIFGTNLLTGGLFHCFEEKEYQTESKRNETFGRVNFGTEAIQETWSRHQGSFEGGRRQGGTLYPLGRAPTLVGPSRLPRPTSFSYISLRNLKTSKTKIDREFRRRKPL